MTSAAVDYADIQGVVRFAYKHLTDATYFLLKIKDRAAARRWLQRAPIATAAEQSPSPQNALQIAMTASGLRSLGVPERVVAGFSPEFLAGMSADEDRSRRLGDVGANATANWEWGTGDRLPDLLAAIFAAPGTLNTFAAAVQTPDWNAAFEPIASLDTSNLGGVEQFGFTDGISQPAPDWDRRRALRGDKVSYSPTVALGEFLLGYPNEYDCYTERPLLDPGGVNDLLPLAEDDPGKRDAGKNGSYLVLRDLLQDVRAFWSFAVTEDLAQKFVGRKMNGDPLVAFPAGSQNQFTYDADPSGVRCPYGAHIRRANPRNADFPGAPRGPIATGLQMLGFRKSAFHDDLISPVRFHRIIRRGREYGPALSPADAQSPAPPDDPPRGLRFVCLNANIERQFEFLQNAWIASDSFNGLIGESDPLLGNREPAHGGRATGTFVCNRASSARTRIGGVPRFITVKGGAYFFLPGMRALRYFLAVGSEKTP